MKQLFLSLAMVFCASTTIAAEVDSAALILRSNPYLQNPTDQGITVCWQTALPCESYVLWGRDSASMQRAHTLVAGQVISNNTLNKIRLNGVEEGAKYYYRIVSRHITSYGAYKKTFGGTYRSPIYSFSIPKKTETDFNIMVFNDLHQHTATMDTLMAMVKSKKLAYDLVVFNGDCIDDPQNETQAISSINYFNNAVGASSVPVIYIRGNHEIRGAYSMLLTLLFDYVGGEIYGAMNWGDTRFVMLDCGEDKPDEHPVYYGLNDFSGLRVDQLTFLDREHKNPEFRKASKRILIHHIPLWGLDKGDYNPCNAIWGKTIAAAPYDLSINGHTHQAKMYPRAAIGNSMPVAIGGGYQIKTASVMHLVKRGNVVSLTCLDAKGDTLYKIVI